MSHHKRKRVIITLTPAEQSDPRSIIAATRKALQEQAKLVLEVRTKCEEADKADGDEDSIEARRMALEVLETVVNQVAAEALRLKKQDAEPRVEETQAKDGVQSPEIQEEKDYRWWRAVKTSGKVIAWVFKEGIKTVIGEGVKAAGK